MLPRDIGIAPPPGPPYGQPDCKIPVFFTPSLLTCIDAEFCGVGWDKGEVGRGGGGDRDTTAYFTARESPV